MRLAAEVKRGFNIIIEKREKRENYRYYFRLRASSRLSTKIKLRPFHSLSHLTYLSCHTQSNLPKMN